jgi:hypothetical protein
MWDISAIAVAVAVYRSNNSNVRYLAFALRNNNQIVAVRVAVPRAQILYSVESGNGTAYIRFTLLGLFG